MKLSGLIDLSLVLILASNSKGQTWNISVSRHITATLGSDVIIPCTFTCRPKCHTENVEVYWKKPVRSEFNINDNDKNAFILHKNDTIVHKNYKQKTMLIGNKTKGNCSLKIKNITENEPNIYVRVIASGEKYSFFKNYVSISVSGAMPVTLGPDITTYIPTPFTTTAKSENAMTQETTIYIAIFVPFAALLIIIFVTGIVLYRKHKRSQSLTREESGYYANFSTASSNQAKREAFFQKHDNEKLCEPKAIDEPVYINIEAPPAQMDQSMDHTAHTDVIYANVDSSK